MMNFSHKNKKVLKTNKTFWYKFFFCRDVFGVQAVFFCYDWEGYMVWFFFFHYFFTHANKLKRCYFSMLFFHPFLTWSSHRADLSENNTFSVCILCALYIETFMKPTYRLVGKVFFSYFQIHYYFSFVNNKMKSSSAK